MDRRTTIGLIIVLAVIAGAVIYFGLRPGPAKAPGASTGASAIANPYVERTQYYDIAANYPTTTPLSAQASKAAAEAMQGWVIDTVSQFKNDGASNQGRKLSLQIIYLIASSPHTVSYIFTTSEDMGGAHPNSFFKTFTFNMTTGKQLALGELFAPGADYLGTLSRIARAKLPEIIGQYADQKMIADDTTPDAKNFQNFFIDNATLNILFDPYAVAAYAAGPQTLQIPLADLASILGGEHKP
ncbi:MAG: RsiV family protein [bacterium]|nr:RsiV family protein [bacterium]